MQLASKLINKGIDVILDKWSLQPGDDLPHFMEKSLRDADYVLMVCTDSYISKANAGEGGVGYEKSIMTATYLKSINNNKVIPIIRQAGTANTPTFMGAKFYIDLSITANFEVGFDELCRTVLDAPLYQKPELGTNPYGEIKTEPTPEPKEINDPVISVVKTVLNYFESGKDETHYVYIRESHSDMSRVMFDIVCAKAIKLGYIHTRRDRRGNILFSLTEGGKVFSLENNLVM
jgi:hypothetical protein